MPLNPKQQMFCEQYLIDRNATQAAIRAGYSKHTADVQGSRLLGYAGVAEYIKSKSQKQLERLELTQDKVNLLYAAMALYDPRRVYAPDGTVKPLTEWSDAEAMALTGFELDETVKVAGGKAKKTTTTIRLKKIKFTDRKGVLDSIARMGGYDAPKPPPPGTSTGELTVPFDMSKYTDEELAILAKGFKP